MASKRPKENSPTCTPKRKKTTALNKSSPTRNSRPCDPLTGGLSPSNDQTQPQAENSASSPSTDANSLQPVPPLSKAAEMLSESPQSRGRKRKRECEEGNSDNHRSRPSGTTDTPAVVVKRLNKKDLKELNRLNRRKELEVCDDMSQNKRSRSRSSVADLSEDNATTASTSTHKTSLSLSDYRLIILDRQRIVFEHGKKPGEVQVRLDTILRSHISEDDKQEVVSISESLCDDFVDVLSAACREDDSVELIYRALELMNKNLLNQVFAIRRKADWDPALKPVVQMRRYTSVPPVKTHNATNTAPNPDRANKKLQPYITPDESALTMPPPPVPSKQDFSGVKTPCPDIAIGLHHRVVTAKLESLGVPRTSSDELLKDLQYGKTLISCPTTSALLLRFPSLVVEGKSYATGKSLYEAQNQAAVSGSMMLVIQHQLYELAGVDSPNSPLAFSVCSEGPVIELWVHYTISDEGARYYKSHFVRICHVSVLETVVEFFLAILRIMRWSKSIFLDDVAEKLLSVWQSY